MAANLPLIVPEMYRVYHEFPNLAEKYLIDKSCLKAIYDANIEDPFGSLATATGENALFYSTECVLEEFLRGYQANAVVLPPRLLFLKCMHSVTASLNADQCVELCLGNHNSVKLVLATVKNATIANRVTGLPVVTPHGGSFRYLPPTQFQIRYCRKPAQIPIDTATEKKETETRLENLRRRARKKGTR